jgi:WD40 repeat protein
VRCLPLLAIAIGLAPSGARGADDALTLAGHKGFVTAVAFTPDGKRIVSGSEDDTVRIWDAKTAKEVRSVTVGGQGVTSVAVSRDGKRIAVGCWGQTARVFGADSGKELLTLKSHKETVTSVAFSPSGDRVATGSADDTLKIWEAKTGQLLLTLESGNDYDVTAVCFSPDGKRLASGDGDNVVTVWEAPSAKPEGFAKTGDADPTLHGHDAIVTAVAFSSDGKALASASRDDTVRVWDAKTGKCLLTL